MAAQLSVYRGEETEETGLQLDELVERYLAASGASAATRVEYGTTVRKYRDWLDEPRLREALAAMQDGSDGGRSSANCVRSTRPDAVRALNRESLAEFLEWVRIQSEHDDSSNPGRTHNKVRGNLSAALRWACEQGLIDAVPQLPKKREQRDEAGLHFLDESEINRLYWATHRLSLRGWRETYAPLGAYWRAALVVFYNYGVDTGTVFGYLPRHEPLLWRHVSFDADCPDRSQKIEAEWGWLYYRRTKTGRKFMRPLNRVVSEHLRSLLPRRPQAVPDEMLEEEIFRGGSTRPADRFRALCRLAKLAPKLDFETGKTSDWTFKDLRKTASTWHDQNVPGSGSAVLGHAIEGSARVTAKHYSNTSPLAAKSILTLPQPASFRSIYDDSIRPPDQFFAK